MVQLYRQRLGAATLSADGVDLEELARLAVEAGCVGLVRYIAECGQEVEPEHPFWRGLLDALPWEPPHITRLIAMTGITRKGPGIVRQWIRPSGMDANER